MCKLKKKYNALSLLECVLVELSAELGIDAAEAAAAGGVGRVVGRFARGHLLADQRDAHLAGAAVVAETHRRRFFVFGPRGLRRPPHREHGGLLRRATTAVLDLQVAAAQLQTLIGAAQHLHQTMQNRP